MARDKKDKEGPKPVGASKQLNINQFSKLSYGAPSESEQEYEEAYEVTEEELFGYAEFLGIRLPEEEDLLWIAEEGICAELPEGWTTEESDDDGEVVYVNLKTGEKCTVHPCDEYYKQLVLQERRKKGGKGFGGNKKAPAGISQLNNSKPQGMQPQMIQPVQAKPVAVDPLVKMQQEKAQRKL